MMSNKRTYPIKAVAQRTGLSQHVIRAWEKRYGAVVPHRTETNWRVYSENQVRRLELLQAAIAAGHSIGSIARLTHEELKALTAVTRADRDMISAAGDTVLEAGLSVRERSRECVKAIKELDAPGLEIALMRASFALSQPVLIDELVLPLIQQIGDLWQEGILRVAHEHMASAVIRTFLSNLRSTIEIPRSAPRIVMATPVGQQHELGALAVAVVAAAQGWQVTYLGANLPAEEIGAAIRDTGSNVLAMSLVYPAGDPRLLQDLMKLRHYLQTGVSLIVGGRAASSYGDILNDLGAMILASLNSFRTELNRLSNPEAGNPPTPN